jgi:hypothetical protein
LEGITQQVEKLLASCLIKDILYDLQLSIVDGVDQGVPSVSQENFFLPKIGHKFVVLVFAVNASHIAVCSIESACIIEQSLDCLVLGQIVKSVNFLRIGNLMVQEPEQVDGLFR